MALTRNFLKSMALTDEQVSAIIEAHADTVDSLKKQITEAQQAAGSTQAVTQERDQLKQQLEDLRKNSGDAAKVQADFDAYKQQVEGEKLTARKISALDAFFKKNGVQRESFRAAMLKAWNLDDVELNADDTLKDPEAIATIIATDYADFVATTQANGVPPANPPAGGNGGRKMTREEIAKITNPDQMRAAIAENIELFQ